MIMSEEYALSSRRRARPLRVTALETDPEVCGRGWVEIRFEDGMPKGRIEKVSSQRVLAPWDERDEPRPKKQSKPRPMVVRGPWPPEAGEPIHWYRTPGIRWTVESVDRGARTATISGELFGQRKQHTIAWVHLQPYEEQLEVDEIEDVTPPPVPEPQPAPASAESSPTPPVRERERLADTQDEPRSPVDSFVDRLIFSPEALERYRRRFAKSLSSQRASQKLERELRRRGEIRQRNWRAPGAADEYLRIRVEGRFEVVLREPTERNEAIVISETDLRIFNSKRRRGQQPGSSKRAA
jgi:hypothetical protein